MRFIAVLTMNSRHFITLILKEWLELTLRESRDIQVGRWSDLSEIQERKSVLKQPLQRAVERWKIDHRREAAIHSFPGEINQLFNLETQNSPLLAVRKRQVREKILLLEQALASVCHFQFPSKPSAAAA